MITAQVHTLLHQALSSLQVAETELNRPKEDAVNISACFGARQCIAGLLRGYLFAMGCDLKGEMSLQELNEQCAKLAPEFSGIDLAQISCRQMDSQSYKEHYCLGQEDIRRCIEIASRVKQLVLKNLGLNERELN